MSAVTLREMPQLGAVALQDVPRQPVYRRTETPPCRSHDPELWFAEHAAQVEMAKALCRSCPLTEICLAGALERAEPCGVWGGQVFLSGTVVSTKRGRGRPRKV